MLVDTLERDMPLLFLSLVISSSVLFLSFGCKIQKFPTVHLAICTFPGKKNTKNNST